MKNSIILTGTLLFACCLLNSCDDSRKSENMLAADKTYTEAKVAGASDLAPIEFYQAEKQYNAYEAAWKHDKFVEADYSAAIALYLSKAALVRTENSRMNESIKQSKVEILQIEKDTVSVDNEIKDLQLKSKDLTIKDRNQLLAVRDKKLTELDGKYRQLYASKMKNEETALKNIDKYSAQIAVLQKQVDLSQNDLSKLSAEDQTRRKLALEQVAVLNKQLQDELSHTERLQQDNETLAMKVNAEQLKNQSVLAIGNAKVMKVKAENMGAKEGAAKLYGDGEKALASAEQKFNSGAYIESRALAITAGNLYNDSITTANSRYLEESERLRKAREEIKAVFRGLEDTEITDQKGQVKIIMRGALFAFNKTDLLDRFHDRLDKLAEILVRYNEFPISVEGHTDNVGKDTYNLNLSSDRAGSITTYLIDKGRIEGRRIVALGYGKSRPVASNDTEAGRSRNRRVEIILQRNFSPGDKR